MKFPQTLSFRLALWYVLAFVLSILLAFMVFFLSLTTIFEKQTWVELTDDMYELQALFDGGGLDAVIAELDEEIADESAHMFFYRVYDKAGALRMSSDLSSWAKLDAPTPEQLSNQQEVQILQSNSAVRKHLSAFATLGEEYVVQTGMAATSNESLNTVLTKALLLMLSIFIPIAAMLGWLLSRSAVNGINGIHRTIQSISAGNLGQRVEVEASDAEIQNLAEAFNAMLDRIQSLVSEMRDLTDNIAHDLRSPLTRIRTNAEQALAFSAGSAENTKAIGSAIRDCDELMHLVNTILDVAEAESGVTRVSMSETNLTDLITDVCDLFQPAIEFAGIEMAVDIASGADACVNGDDDSLRRMFTNILDNAIKYTPVDGTITVRVLNKETFVQVEVADTGCGIASSDQQRIFERFYRCDQSRLKEGTGLGLTYSAAIAKMHDGAVIVNSTIGRGSQFVVRIPCFSRQQANETQVLPVGNAAIMLR